MRYTVEAKDKREVRRLTFPPPDDGGEPGWADVSRLSAADYLAAEKEALAAGIPSLRGSLRGAVMIIKRALRGWSLDLPLDPEHKNRSIGSLSIDLLNWLGNEINEDSEVDEDEEGDLSNGPSQPSSEAAPSLES